MRLALAVFLLCCSLSVQATAYRWIDEEGHVVFGDDPPEGVNAQPLKLRSPIVIPAPKLPESRPEPTTGTGAPSPAESRYQSLAIQSPENDGTVRQNAGNVSVSLTLSPALNTAAGHQVELLLDGEPKVKGQALQLLLPQVDRGTHQLSARVLSGDGQVLIESPTVSFTLHRHSILHPQRSTPLPGAGTPPAGGTGNP